MVVVLLAVVAVTARLVDVQVVGRERYVAYGSGQRDGLRELPAGRGAILDRDGRAFAMSAAQPQVVIDPTQIDGVRKTARALAKATGHQEDVAAVEAELRAAKAERTPSGKPRRYHVLDLPITAEQAAGLRALDLPGVAIEERFVRSTPSGDLARAVVGRALADGQVQEGGVKGQGLWGIERQYDDALHGTPGKVAYERDPAGRTIAGGRHEVQEAKPGTDLYLTLDQSLQFDTEQVLARQVADTGAQGAMAVVMKPSTGEVLALASVGVTEDGEVEGTGDAKPLTSVFEPGSVNKMITIAGAIEDGKVTPETVLHVPDHLQIYDRTFSDHDPHPDADWSVTDILVTSSNIGTIKIAQKLGGERVDHYLRQFGFGKETGLDFPAESAGIMRPYDEWSGVDIGAIPIGQGVAVTAMQMLSAYNVVANDGVYVAPKLVAATDRGDGRTPTEPSARRRVISASTARSVRGMLDKVVSDGTGQRAAVPGYVPGGKTGTARIPQKEHMPDDGYMGLDGRYHYESSFVGFIDGADLSIMVTVRDAQTSIFGGDVAAPVFSQLAAIALRKYQIPPPALAAAAERSVPELSASAKEVNGEDVTGGSRTQAG